MKWLRGHSCYILAKNLAAICLCLNKLRLKLKVIDLICLAEEMSRLHSGCGMVTAYCSYPGAELRESREWSTKI